MPYIKQEDRPRLMEGAAPQTTGELNYVITVEMIEVWTVFKQKMHPDFNNLTNNIKMAVEKYLQLQPLNYQRINDVVGAVTGAWLEFVRRTVGFAGLATIDLDTAELLDEVQHTVHTVLGDFYNDVVAPYEDKKIKENGDVYPR